MLPPPPREIGIQEQNDVVRKLGQIASQPCVDDGIPQHISQLQNYGCLWPQFLVSIELCVHFRFRPWGQ